MNRFATANTASHSSPPTGQPTMRLHQAVGEVVPGRDEQDKEAPEDRCVGKPRADVIQQPPLAEDVDQDALDPRQRSISATQRSAGAQDGEVHPQPAPEERHGDDDREDDERVERDGGRHAPPMLAARRRPNPLVIASGELVDRVTQDRQDGLQRLGRPANRPGQVDDERPPP